MAGANGPAPENQESVRKRHPAVLPLVFTGLIACVFAFLCWQLWSEHAEAKRKADAAASRMDELVRTRDELRNLLNLSPCDAKKRLVPVSQAPAKGAAASASSTSAVSPAPGMPQTPPASDEVRQASAQSQSQAKSSLQPAPGQGGKGGKVDNIEKACVFLVATDGRTHLSTGSGFFVAPGYVVTNRHVVEHGAGKAFVTSRSLGKPAIAKVVATSSGKNEDYALLAVEMPEGANISVLPFAASAAKTERVGAWGFPDVIGKSDPAYARLLAGKDLSAVPELSYSEGVVSAVLPGKPQIIVHTAPISPGNSGGPLVNESGEVVGINTMITLDESSYRQASLALAAGDLIRFLAAHGLKL